MDRPVLGRPIAGVNARSTALKMTILYDTHSLNSLWEEVPLRQHSKSHATSRAGITRVSGDAATPARDRAHRMP